MKPAPPVRRLPQKNPATVHRPPSLSPPAADRTAEPPTARSPAPPEAVCPVCGSTEIRERHAKVFCAKCHALLENCCGD